jgi:glycosyltransferase involved in cell wall biosynthesis
MTIAAAFLSIVIEWENAHRTGVDRARLMLMELDRQLGDARANGLARCELIFVCDGDGDEARIRDALSRAQAPCDIRILTSPSPDYYEQKSFGAAAARGDVVVFLDSDVVPEAGWLAALLAPFADPNVSIVSGTSFIEVTGLYSAAMALGWIFPVRSGTGQLAEVRTFFANNIAFRGELIRRNPFPRTGQYRGQCIALAEQLRAQGHVVYLNRAAAVSHPPPEGASGFALRALRNGHDEAAFLRRKRRSLLRHGPPAVFKKLAAALANVWRGYRRFGLGPAGAAAAAAIVAAYYALQLAGLIATAAAPATARRLLVGAGPGAAPAELSPARG